MRYSTSLFCLAFVLVGSSAFAQWSKSVSVSTSYDNNAFRNYTGLSDYATQLSLYLAREGGSETHQSRLYYKGYYDIFAENGERNFHVHQLGAAWARKLSSGGNVLNLGANASLRANRNVYDYYNFKEAAGYGNLKLTLGPSTLTNFGYKVRARWYSNIPQLTSVEHDLFVRYTHFFATRTTFMIEANYGRKHYREQVTGGVIPQGDRVGDYGHHLGGMGHMGRGDRVDATSSDSFKPNVSQWVGQLRLAQSLTNVTGLSAEFVLRRNPGDGIRYLAGQVSGYTTEDELFDDRYGYESEEVSSTLTQLLLWQMTAKAGLEARWKDYVNRPALDLNGEALPSGDLRSDRQFLIWLSLSKSLTMFGNKTVNLAGEFYWMDNRSNDLYYDYGVSLVSLTVTTSF